MRKFLTLFFILVLSCFLPKTSRMSRRDIVYLKSGEEFVGELIEWKEDTLIFWTQDTILKIDLSSISSMDFTRKREGDLWVSKDDIDDPVLKDVLNQKEEPWYQDGGYVTLLRKREFFLLEDSRIVERTRVINRVLKERGKSVANQRFTYLSSTDTAKLLFARGITQDGNVVPIRENAIEDAPVFQKFLLYNDLRQKKFAIPESRIGSLLDYSYKIEKRRRSTRPFFASINFGGWEPIKEDSVVVNVPPNEKISYKTDRLSEPSIKRTENNIQYVWVSRNTKARKEENFAPPFKDIFPRLTVATSMTWADVDSILSSQLEDSLVYPKEIAHRLKKMDDLKMSSVLDSLYYLVCREIRYAPVPINTIIPVPRSLKTIYKTKYANSLDKTYFLHGLLKKREIENYIVLTRSKGQGEFIKEVPSPIQFSHALLLVVLDGDTLFLDPKHDTYMKGYISREIQGQDGLVLATRGRFVKIPLLDIEGKNVKMTVIIDEDGSCDIEKTEYLFGENGVMCRSLKEMKEEEIRKTIEEDVACVHPGAELIDYSLSPLFDLTREVILSVHYRIENFALLAGDFLFVGLPEINYSAASVGSTERDLPLFFNSSDFVEHTINFVVPEGFSVYHTGENRNLKKDFVTFSCEFLNEGNEVVYKDYFKRNATLIDASKYSDYRVSMQLMGEVTNELLVLRKER